MTKHTTPRDRNELPPGQLLEFIAAELTAQPRTSLELAGITGYAVATCRLRLLALERLGRAHRLGTTVDGQHCVLWHPGPRSVRSKSIPFVAAPSQFTVRQYPPINRRDPLVAALFGAPGVKP